MTYKQIEKAKNRYKFEAEVPYKDFESEREKVVNILAQNVKIPGFRPGKAPKDAVEKEVGYKAYLEAVNRILPRAALEVVEKEMLNPISSFKYDLKDLDKDKDISFTFEFINQPEIKLSDFKNIKVEYKETPVEKGEADKVIKNIIKSSLPRERWEKNIIGGKKLEIIGEEKHDHEHDHAGHNHKHAEPEEDITITDDLVAEIGYEEEKTYEGIKKRVEETLERLKKEDAENQFASKVIEEALKVSDFEIPDDFVEHEVEHKEGHFRERLKDLKLAEDMYLKTQGTTMDELKKTWEDEAKRNIKTDLLLINLGVSENIIPTEAEVDAEIEKIQDPETKKRYQTEENRNYLKTALTRDKALVKLMDSVKKK